MSAPLPSPELAVRGRALVGEGPLWVPSEAALYWVDIKGESIHRLETAVGSVQEWRVPERIGAIAHRASGGFAVLLKSGLYISDADFRGFTKVHDPEPDQPGNRFNDAKCDPRGRLWAGTMDDSEMAVSGSLYRFDPDGRATRMLGDLHLSNGLGWSPDGLRFYHTDTLRRTIRVHDFDPDQGTLSNARPFALVGEGEGWPDGLAVDAEGFVWSAHWDGWRITRYAPDGRVAAVVPMPVPRPSSCAFGGSDLRDLYITSAAIGLDENAVRAAPLSGSLFALRSPVAGAAIPPFAG